MEQSWNRFLFVSGCVTVGLVFVALNWEDIRRLQLIHYNYYYHYILRLFFSFTISPDCLIDDFKILSFRASILEIQI